MRPGMSHPAVSAARALVGAPFRPHGRDPETGLDCLGLVIHVAAALGVRACVPAYSLNGDQRALEAGLIAHGLAVLPAAAALPGDVLLLAVDAERRHLAIRTPGGAIHAHARLGRVVEHRLPPAWADALIAAYRFPEQISTCPGIAPGA